MGLNDEQLHWAKEVDELYDAMLKIPKAKRATVNIRKFSLVQNELNVIHEQMKNEIAWFDSYINTTSLPDVFMEEYDAILKNMKNAQKER